MGGGSETNARSEYPPEFRPLAESAVNSIKQLQSVLPLSMFAAANPQGTADLSPWQRAAMQLIPALNQTAEPINEMNRLGTPISYNALAMQYAGDTTPAAQGALNVLSKYAPGRDLTTDPFTANLGSWTAQGSMGDMPWSRQQSLAFPGGTNFPSDEATKGGWGEQVVYGTPLSFNAESGVAPGAPGPWAQDWWSPMVQYVTTPGGGGGNA